MDLDLMFVQINIYFKVDSWIKAQLILSIKL